MCICDPAPVDLSIANYLRDNSDVDFQFVALGGARRAGDPPRYFLADYRDQAGYTEPWVCIHSWTASPASLLRNLNWQARFERESQQLWVFEARNKGQIAVWLEEQGYVTKFMGKREAPMPAQERIIVNSRERQLASAEATMARAQARIDRLMSLPEEPTTDDPDGALAVWFLHRFTPNGTVYTYGAVKAGDGKWYTTGPQHGGHPRTWEELVNWHYTDLNEGHPMYVATEWEIVS